MLVGGIQAVTLGDAAARKLKKGNKLHKVQLERMGPPTFGIVVELLERSKWCIYHDVAETIDALLSGENPVVEQRWKVAQQFIFLF